MADFKFRLSNAYPSGAAAFRAMQQQSPQQGTSGLSLPAFVTGCQSFRPPLTAEEGQAAFQGLDADRNGEVSESEFLDLLWTGHFLPNSADPAALGQVATTITSSKGPTTTKPRPTTTTAAPRTTAEPTTTRPASTRRPRPTPKPAEPLPTAQAAYEFTNAVLKEEGQSLGDFIDRFYSLEECEVHCDRTRDCNSFAYFNGDCHLKDRCVLASDPVDKRSKFRTYYKSCTPKAFLYEELGPGYCAAGYYAGGQPADAANLARCQAKCSAEPQCKFFSLHLGDTCSRYTSKAGNCSHRPSGKRDHVSYRKQPLAPPLSEEATTTQAPKILVQEGEEEVREEESEQEMRAKLKRTFSSAPLDEEEPITMSDFKARMLKAYASAMHAFQALGNNPSGLEDFVRGATTFRPPLTFEEARYAFRGLDTDHDDLLRSFEFFEVIECGHFFPTTKELKALKGSAQAYSDAELEDRPSGGGGVSTPLLVLLFGLAMCLVAAVMGIVIRLKGKDDRQCHKSYTAIEFSQVRTASRSATSTFGASLSTGASSLGSQRALISL